MQYISRVKNLDEVLLVLNDDLIHSIIETNAELEQDGIIFGNDQFIIALKKLHKDGYVEYDGGNAIMITWEGSLFIELGGYKAKALKDANDALLVQMEINRRLQQDEGLKNLSSRLNQWTLWLAIGTGFLALIEIIKFLCEVDPSIKAFFEKTL
ncbi:hypothetical protein JN11_04785 [Mucilaginibacter frigoritolerans]|uniref:Uncharacterized protein n=1 Tax=Mucilaginibacter frigoritolerans TaxID=652788 RepID=A0A562TKT9_9SPHI|nr:hypothetical protein [Mucilaginibacter frigoritolerans]TWI94179.1 hypothetical protein JN11_04785 [Mucilaginibacter frigoritolerans]